jgi:superfamily I DNA/RNA helicase/RecB family exonuclease
MAERTASENEIEWRIEPNDWPSAVGASEGPQIVVGGPGTGKTEFLVRRLLHLSHEVNTAELLVLSFGRRGVADLAERVRSGLDRTIGQLDIATFHSFAGRVVERHYAARGWIEPPVVLTGPEQVALVAELLSSEDPRRWSPAFRGLLNSPTFAAEVTDFLLRVREQLVDAGELAATAEQRADWRGLPQFLTRYDLALRRNRRIDYGTLLAEAIAALDLDDVAADVAGRYHYLLVDEYQDTTVAQAALLERLAAGHRNLTVAADPYQSIYSFRGADLANVADFPLRFRAADGTAGRRMVLSTSFRTPAAVLAAAVRVTSRELPGAAGAVTPAPGQGRVDVFQFEQETEEAEWVATEVLRQHMEGVALRDMAVFVRTKRRFVNELSRALARRGIPHDTPEARLADQPAVRFLLDLVVAATDDSPGEVARATRRLLLGPLFRIRLGRLRDVEREAMGGGRGWADAIRDLIPAAGALAELIDEPSWAMDSPASAGFWRVWSSLPQLAALVGDPARSDERAAWASLAQVLDRWNDRNPTATLGEYRELSETEEFEASPLLSYRGPETDRLTLTTLHQSKGLEFEIVFIADAVEGVFPDLRSRDSLLGVRHLLPHVPSDAAGYARFRLQEERRLAYTAMTRARRRVVWSATAAGLEQGDGIPSRFLALVAGTATTAAAASRPPDAGTPVTAGEGEAWLRRVLVDADTPAPRRLAAAAVLADGQHWGLRHIDEFAGLRERGPDTGLIGGRLVMSPSQAERYEQCPRRYALERRLRVGEETTVYAEFGRLIHETLEHVERAALDRGEPHAGATEALAHLESRFDPTMFGGGAFAAAWHDRAVDTLERLYAMWPTRGKVLALERRLELQLDDTAWVGYADRIETDGIGLTVVDYKTTKNPPTQPEAAGSLQLGYYTLAAAADEELAKHGSPQAAEFWFPAKAAVRGLTRRSFDPELLPEVRDRLKEAAAGIRAEDWRAHPGPDCNRCRVRSACPSQPEGREAFA